MYCLR